MCVLSLVNASYALQFPRQRAVPMTMGLSARSRTTKIETGPAFDEALTTNKRTAIMISAPWCRACKAVVPKFARLSKDDVLGEEVAFFELSHPDIEAVEASSLYWESEAISVTPMVMLYQGTDRVDMFKAGPTRFKSMRPKLERWLEGGDPSSVVPPDPVAKAKAHGSTVDAGSPLPPTPDDSSGGASATGPRRPRMRRPPAAVAR